MADIASPPWSVAATWHDVECGAYAADLPLWRRLAAEAGGPILDLGCGTGRVALDLARAGHEVTGIDSDPELIAECNARAVAENISVTALTGDARSLNLDREFALILAPMQLIQMLSGPDARAACLRGARAHLSGEGRAAFALVSPPPPALDESAALLPDLGERDGWVFSSLPLDVRVEDGTITILRLRQTVSPSGDLTDEHDTVDLRVLSPEELTQEAVGAGLGALDRVSVPPTDDHLGSEVVVVEAR